MRPYLRLPAGVLLTLIAASLSAAAQAAPSPTTSEVFSRFADRVIKIHVVETSSSAKAELGTGFFVSADGHVVTNYHVISKVANDPARYRADWIDANATAHPLHLLAVDVARDLAILKADYHPPAYFTLAPAAVAQGTRLYSMGHPNDLGLSIVEGTYNGLLKYTLYPKIHFSGDINPGMSGGPAITEDGRVIGVNVATEGDGIGFLVPVANAMALAQRALAPGYEPPKSFLKMIGTQLLAYQDEYLAKLFTDSTPTVTLGRYRLPTQPAPFFKCWADATRRSADQPYDFISHRCSTDDYVFLSPDQSTGTVEMDHRLYTSSDLGHIRFYALYQARFQAGHDDMDGDPNDVTRFACETRNVRHDSTLVRAALCLRRYVKFPGLYDAVLKAAVLGQRNSGVLTTLTLSGVSFENAERLSTRYLAQISTTSVRPAR
jgi:S1-C subfamily serine protease